MHLLLNHGILGIRFANVYWEFFIASLMQVTILDYIVLIKLPRCYHKGIARQPNKIEKDSEVMV